MKKIQNIILIIIILLFLVSCNSYCPQSETKNSIEKLSLIESKWVDAFNLARSTPRIQLSQQVSALQTIKRDLDNLKLPDCLNQAKIFFGDSMDNAIEGFMAFMREASSSTVSNYMKIADDAHWNFGTQINKISNCLPNCKP